MKSSIRILFIACCAVSLLAGHARSADLNTKAGSQESVRGYLVDTLCVKEEAAQLASLGTKHTRKCLQMPTCRESGYALLVPSQNNNNDVLRLDKHGNDLAVRLVNSRHGESGWLLRATGKRNGDKFAVTTLEIVSAPPAKHSK
jgi:hypothetical protein